MNKKNLMKLAAYLGAGHLRAKFDMNSFDDGEKWDQERTTCGTVGCALGHGPYAGVRKRETEGWEEYGDRAIGLSMLSDEWDWCFSYNWASVDGSAISAAKRIYWLIARGLPTKFAKYGPDYTVRPHRNVSLATLRAEAEAAMQPRNRKAR